MAEWIGEDYCPVMQGDTKAPAFPDEFVVNGYLSRHNTEMIGHLEDVAKYNGVGAWFMQRSEHGIAIVLIYTDGPNKGKREYIVAQDYAICPLQGEE